MTKLRKGYIAIDATLMTACDRGITKALFGAEHICAGCYLDRDGESCDCIVNDWEVIVPEHTVAIIKMNQVGRR
mgnify:FL=1